MFFRDRIAFSRMPKCESHIPRVISVCAVTRELVCCLSSIVNKYYETNPEVFNIMGKVVVKTDIYSNGSRYKNTT